MKLVGHEPKSLMEEGQGGGEGRRGGEEGRGGGEGRRGREEGKEGGEGRRSRFTVLSIHPLITAAAMHLPALFMDTPPCSPVPYQSHQCTQCSLLVGSPSFQGRSEGLDLDLDLDRGLDLDLGLGLDLGLLSGLDRAGPWPQKK